ncbi:P-loop containing nucleoside triphosphate hydrolase protein [Phaeosphaeriaceae sp. PMI808]|nr:P-loop containing nucleoside triphosphate hydrolase protein [Phaeosphaeriaceae sp. PMI808]
MSIVGLGGMGKTQIALNFAYFVKETLPEFSIFWMPAFSMETFKQACADIARELHLIEADNNKVDAREIVRQYLSTKQAGRWLLVLDNADDSEIVFGTNQLKGVVNYLPESEQGITLFTTRVREIAISLTRGDVLELEQMSKEDAATFLTKSLIRQNLYDNTAMAELLDELAYLPLAITQAAAYLNTNRTTIAKYLNLLRNTEQGIVSLMTKEFRDNTRYKGPVNAVAMTWVVPFRQLQAHDPRAADLLAFILCIEWKAIPRSLLPHLGSEERLEDAIGALRGYSFLSTREENNVDEASGEEEWYDLHRLVHLASRIWTKEHGIAADAERRAVDHVAKVFPRRDYMARVVWRAYMPHALRLLEMKHLLNEEGKAGLSLWVGWCMRADGRMRQSTKWLEESCLLREKLEETHPNRLESQHELAVLYTMNRYAKRASQMLERIVDIKEQELGKENYCVQASQHALAAAYLNIGEVKEAIALYQHIISIYEKFVVKEDPSLLGSQHELARAYLDDGQITRAITLLENVVNTHKRVLSETHHNLLASQLNLGVAYMDDGQLQKALRLLQHVVGIQEQVLIESHPGHLSSQQKLAEAYTKDGQLQKALPLLEHVVAIGEQTLKEDNLERLRSEALLAETYLKDKLASFKGQSHC